MNMLAKVEKCLFNEDETTPFRLPSIFAKKITPHPYRCGVISFHSSVIPFAQEREAASHLVSNFFTRVQLCSSPFSV